MAIDCISREMAKAKKVYSQERHEYVIPVAEIDWIPAVDVVEVVRCIDCTHSHKKKMFPTKLMCDIDLNSVREDFFCANGDRRAE